MLMPTMKSREAAAGKIENANPLSERRKVPRSIPLPQSLDLPRNSAQLLAHCLQESGPLRCAKNPPTQIVDWQGVEVVEARGFEPLTLRLPA